MGPLIVFGTHAAAAARSAARAGYQPVLLTDRPTAESHGLPTHLYPTGRDPEALRLLPRCPRRAQVLCTGPLENHATTLAALAYDHTLLGSSAKAAAAARSPTALTTLPLTPGLRLPKTQPVAGLGMRLRQLAFGVLGKRVLIKPIASFAGHHIGFWSALSRVGDDHYLQQFVKGGTPHSAVFYADGWSASLLGVTEQLVGEPALAAEPFAYCGSIGPVRLSNKAYQAVVHLGVVVTQRYDLRGVFGIDFIVDWIGRVWPVEINPRYPLSAGVLEAANDSSVLVPRVVDADPDRKKQRLSNRDRRKRPYHGQALVFTRRELNMPVLPAELAERCVDTALPGTPLPAGAWVTTVTATAPNRDAVYQALTDDARRVNDVLEG
ncbi:MAG: ATP-grasp domain-containing protein [Planctomycetota bacterium]